MPPLTILTALSLLVPFTPASAALGDASTPATLQSVGDSYVEQAAPALPPAALVASRVRVVLQDHTSATAWQDLAGSLPELAISGGADLESTFEAARLAEEMTYSGARLTQPIVPEGALADGLGVGLWLFSLAFGLTALWLLWSKGVPSLLRGRIHAPMARCDQARLLADSGAPIYEISRRTGLAREALTVLMGPQAQ